MILSSRFLHLGLPKNFIQIKMMLISFFCGAEIIFKAWVQSILLYAWWINEVRCVSVWRGCEETHLQNVKLNAYTPPAAMTDLEMLHVYYLKLPRLIFGHQGEGKHQIELIDVKTACKLWWCSSLAFNFLVVKSFDSIGYTKKTWFVIIPQIFWWQVPSPKSQEIEDITWPHITWNSFPTAQITVYWLSPTLCEERLCISFNTLDFPFAKRDTSFPAWDKERALLHFREADITVGHLHTCGDGAGRFVIKRIQRWLLFYLFFSEQPISHGGMHNCYDWWGVGGELISGAGAIPLFCSASVCLLSISFQLSIYMYFFLSLELSGCQSPVQQSFCFFHTPPFLVIVFSQCHSLSPQLRYSQLTVLQPFCISTNIFIFLNLLLVISLVVCAATHNLQSHCEGCRL